MKSEDLIAIFARYDLGEPLKDPLPLDSMPGASSYYLPTKKGKFLLTETRIPPFKMQNIEAHLELMSHFEKIKESIPIETPLTTSDGLLYLKGSESYYTLKNWITEDREKPEEHEQLRRSGQLLGRLHSIKTEISAPRINLNIDEALLRSLLAEGDKHDSLWHKTLDEHFGWILTFIQDTNKAIERLSSHLVFSHANYDPKQVLWKNKEPIVMHREGNWENVGYIHPGVELIDALIAHGIFPNISMGSGHFITGYLQNAPNFNDVATADIILGALSKRFMRRIVLNMQHSLKTISDAQRDDLSELVIQDIETVHSIYIEIDALSKHMDAFEIFPRVSRHSMLTSHASKKAIAGPIQELKL